jgi:hypothetical protein
VCRDVTAMVKMYLFYSSGTLREVNSIAIAFIVVKRLSPHLLLQYDLYVYS